MKIYTSFASFLPPTLTKKQTNEFAVCGDNFYQTKERVFVWVFFSFLTCPHCLEICRALILSKHKLAAFI